MKSPEDVAGMLRHERGYKVPCRGSVRVRDPGLYITLKLQMGHLALAYCPQRH